MQTEEVDVLDRIRQAKSSSTNSEERKKLDQAEKLITHFRAYEEMTRFKVGDIVAWKPGLRNRRLPGYDDIAIVSGTIEAGRFGPEKSSGSPYFREPESVKVALIDEDDGEFVEFCMDKQRFRHVNEEDCVPRKVQQLRERLEIFLKPSDFKVGDRVYWKPMMKHKKRPNREPAIVLEILDQPFLDEDRPGSQYWHEPLDVKIAMRDNDGEFVSYYFDRRRFQKIDDDDETYGSTAKSDVDDDDNDDDGIPTNGEDDDDDDSMFASDIDPDLD